MASLEGFVRPIQVKAVTGLVARLRRTKDEHEVALIKKAISIQQEALKAVLPTLRAGQTSSRSRPAWKAQMKVRGAEEPGFKTIVAARPTASLPHYRPGRENSPPARPAHRLGAVYQGYHGDMTRVFALGKWPARVREVYQIVLDAQQMAAGALGPRKAHPRRRLAVRPGPHRPDGYGEQFGQRPRARAWA